jgi:hypothetical protein
LHCIALTTRIQGLPEQRYEQTQACSPAVIITEGNHFVHAVGKQ